MARKRVSGAAERVRGDAVLAAVLNELDLRLRRRFGSAYVKVILFGSRARGDHAPDSDADVAVVFGDPIEDGWQIKKQIIEETYPLLLTTGLYIQPWAVSKRDLENPDAAANRALLRSILREGVTA